jgi:hypothetical protein
MCRPETQLFAIVPSTPSDPDVHILLTTYHSSADFSLSLLKISAVSGDLVLKPSAIPSSKVASQQDILLFPSKLAWLNSDGTAYSLALNPASSFRPRAVGKNLFQRIADVDLRDHGYFVATLRNGASQICRFKSSSSSEVETLWEFSDQTPDAIFAGSADKTGEVHISRIYFSPVISVRIIFSLLTLHDAKC